MDWEPASTNSSKGTGRKRGCGVSVIALVVIVVLAIIATRGCAGDRDEKLDWPTTGLAAMLPVPESTEGDVLVNDDDKFSASVDGLARDGFEAYVAACQDRGFTVEAKAGTDEFEAYTEEGHHLKIAFYESLENMDVNLEAPVEMGPIDWPTTGAASLVPAPQSTTGKIDSDSTDFFFAYVGETTAEDYAAYADACSAAGFNVDYDRGDTWYSAKSAAGVSLRLDYVGFGTMTVRVEVPDETAAQDGTDATAEEQEGASAQSSAPAEASGVDPNFKATMDGYESFMNEYVDFMNTYNSDPSNVVSMMARYNDMMKEYADYMATVDAIDENSLSAADLQYYLEVTGRVNQRLLEIGQ